MRFDILAVIPEILEGFRSSSLIGKAVSKGIIDCRIHNLRDWAADKHKTIDDRPYGGGPGMVIKVDVLARAVDDLSRSEQDLILLSPAGRRFDQEMAGKFAGSGRDLLIVCGRYEGVDERFNRLYNPLLLSLGDFCLSGGEVAAMAVVEATARLVPGVVGKAESLVEESFSDGLLDYPVYTRPEVFRGLSVPEVLLSGDHGAVSEWRAGARLDFTRRLRPDMLSGED